MSQKVAQLEAFTYTAETWLRSYYDPQPKNSEILYDYSTENARSQLQKKLIQDLTCTVHTQELI